MNSAEDNIPYGVSEEAERLICRSLDGEITVAERARLDQLLADSPAAMALLSEYERTDALAESAMRRDLAAASIQREAAAHAMVIPFRQRLRPWFVGAAGAILTAAAVVAISVLNAPAPTERPIAINDRPSRSTSEPAGIAPAMVDYRDVDHQPRERWGNVYRDVIGIRGSNPNVIYVIERQTEATQRVPVSGDF